MVMISTDDLSDRRLEWVNFTIDVLRHIEDYTVPQYGDMPDDQASQFSVEDIAQNIRRYVNRVGKGVRGEREALRDWLKVAHYACIGYNKMVEAAREAEKETGV